MGEALPLLVLKLPLTVKFAICGHYDSEYNYSHAHKHGDLSHVWSNNVFMRRRTSAGFTPFVTTQVVPKSSDASISVQLND